jgi:hypothetical protein
MEGFSSENATSYSNQEALLITLIYMMPRQEHDPKGVLKPI